MPPKNEKNVWPLLNLWPNFGHLATQSDTRKFNFSRHYGTYVFKPGTICDDDSIDLVALPVVDHARHLPAVLRAEVHTAGPPAIQL